MSLYYYFDSNGSGRSMPFLPGLNLWLDGSDSSTITKAYQNLAATGSGTSGTTAITASLTEANLVQPGMKLRIGGTDIYTVATVSTVTITTVETLTNTYVSAAMALDRISQWNDKSGNSYNATQGTALSQFVYNPNQLNSKSVLTADGASKMVLPSGLYSLFNGNYTVFVVSLANNNSSEMRLYTASQSGSSKAFLNYASGSSFSTFGARNVASGVGSSTYTVTNPNIIQALVNGTTESIAINNGTAQSDTSASVSASIDALTIGAASDGTKALVGYIAEIIIYNRSLYASEIAQVNRYLANKYAITIS